MPDLTGLTTINTFPHGTPVTVKIRKETTNPNAVWGWIRVIAGHTEFTIFWENEEQLTQMLDAFAHPETRDMS